MKNLLRTTAIVAAAAASVVNAAVDNVVPVVSQANATAGKSIGAFALDPTADTIYVTSFGASAPFAEASLRKVENVSGTQVSTPIMSEGQFQLYYRDGDPDRSVTNPTVSGILLNPKTIGSGSTALAAYSTAVVVDIATTRFPSSNTTDPAATKRFYRWNLQAPPTGGDGRDVFTTISTLQNLQSVAGTSNAVNNIGRQFAYSGDGQSIYALDISTDFGGLWKIDLTTNTPQRLANLTDINTEPAVISSGGVDTIFFRGGASTSNLGGIDKITYDGTTVGARTAHVTRNAIDTFLENAGTGSVQILSTTADAAGNLYFNNTTDLSGKSRGVYRLDPQGRLIKVLGYEERKAVFGAQASGGNPNANNLRMQIRETTFNNGSTSFPVSQLLYTEAAGVNAVAGAFLFEPGDFNRDDVVTAADIELFKANLTLRGVTLSALNPADHPKFRFDLNGNNEVSWKDVKILQQFYGFYDGDADINKKVDISDFAVLAANFNLTGKRWTDGDFDGNETVNITDFAALAANFNQTFPSDLPRSAVPEPAALSAVLLLSAGMIRRRR